jgi:hypothetical protein
VVEATDNTHARGARASQGHRDLTGLDGIAHHRSELPVHLRRRARSVAERSATIDAFDHYTNAPGGERPGSASCHEMLWTGARTVTEGRAGWSADERRRRTGVGYNREGQQRRALAGAWCRL